MAFTREKLSGSTDGTPIKVAATATPGTAVHTATASTTTTWDAIFLWVTNTSAAAATLTIEFGGVTDPDHLVVKALSIPPNSGPTLVINGLMLQNAKLVKAFSGTADVLLVTGYVNRGAP